MESRISAFLYCRRLVSEETEFNTINMVADKVRHSLEILNKDLDSVTEDNTEQEIQQIFYNAGKIYFTDDLRWWFKVLYQVLLKQEEGPRLGQLTKIISVDFVQNKVQNVLDGTWALS